MKSMLLGFVAIAVIAVGADIVLDGIFQIIRTTETLQRQNRLFNDIGAQL